MDETDRRLRNATYGLFVELGRAPSADEVGGAEGLTAVEVEDGWRRLHDAHALVLERDAPRIRMANPFSAVPTPYRVRAGARNWFGNCAWDAIGICAALGVDGEIETACPDCDDPISLALRSMRPEPDDLLFHCLVPAAGWWDDIVHT
jgi:hypothetical protein